MIDEYILQRMRNIVCAVGYLGEPRESSFPLKSAGGIANQLTVVGSGFQVREGVAITNRHVIDDLEGDSRRAGASDKQYLLFIVDQEIRSAAGAHRRILFVDKVVRYAYSLRDTRLDVGFIGFNVNPRQQFEGAELPAIGLPVIEDPNSIRVSEEIAVLGYPHGNSLLERNGKMSRWGPVIQQGWISGIAPFQGVGPPDELLLDVRAAAGISGAPVFRPTTGAVCGVLHSAKPNSDRRDAVTTTAFAQPISTRLLADWLAEFDQNQDSSVGDRPGGRGDAHLG
jgi:hypothetical protein